jgi:hypothetical protein
MSKKVPTRTNGEKWSILKKQWWPTYIYISDSEKKGGQLGQPTRSDPPTPTTLLDEHEWWKDVCGRPNPFGRTKPSTMALPLFNRSWSLSPICKIENFRKGVVVVNCLSKYKQSASSNLTVDASPSCNTMWQRLECLGMLARKCATSATSAPRFQSRRFVHSFHNGLLGFDILRVFILALDIGQNSLKCAYGHAQDRVNTWIAPFPTLKWKVGAKTLSALFTSHSTHTCWLVYMGFVPPCQEQYDSPNGRNLPRELLVDQFIPKRIVLSICPSALIDAKHVEPNCIGPGSLPFNFDKVLQ